jgi:hypothetical protein
MTRAHDPRSRVGNCLDIPAYIKDKRRIVDLLELRRIGGIIQTDDGNTSGRYASHHGPVPSIGQYRAIGAETVGCRSLRVRSATPSRCSGRRRSVRPAAAPGWTEGAGLGQGPAIARTFARSGTHGQGFGRVTTSTSPDDSRTLTPAKSGVKVTRHTPLLKSNIQVEQWLHETPSYFRDFLP